jgi:hypothetical protein
MTRRVQTRGRAGGREPRTHPLHTPALARGKVNFIVVASNMQRHRLNSVAADDSRRLRANGASGDDDASGLHVVEPDVKPAGRPKNRNAAVVRAAAVGTVRSSQDVGRVCPKNLPEFFPSAGPRTVRPLTPQRSVVAVPDSGGFAHGDTPDLAACCGIVEWHATAANPGQLLDTAYCNSGVADAMVERAARSPSADSGVFAYPEGLAVDQHAGHTQAGPRELLLPQVKPRGRVATRPRGASSLRLGAPQL